MINKFYKLGYSNKGLAALLGVTIEELKHVRKTGSDKLDKKLKKAYDEFKETWSKEREFDKETRIKQRLESSMRRYKIKHKPKMV